MSDNIDNTSYSGLNRTERYIFAFLWVIQALLICLGVILLLLGFLTLAYLLVLSSITICVSKKVYQISKIELILLKKRDTGFLKFLLFVIILYGLLLIFFLLAL